MDTPQLGEKVVVGDQHGEDEEVEEDLGDLTDVVDEEEAEDLDEEEEVDLHVVVGEAEAVVLKEVAVVVVQVVKPKMNLMTKWLHTGANYRKRSMKN